MQEAQVERFKKLETKILPEDISYEEIKGIGKACAGKAHEQRRSLC